MVFVNPMPDEVLLEEYNSGYFDNAHGGLQTHPLTVAFHSAINLLRVLYVERFIEKEKISVHRVLEIGPGGGHFARQWMKRNPQTSQYTGVESDKSCHTKLISSNVDVFLSMDEVPADREFDLVVISHVLEHTSNPGDFIKNCTRLLKQSGILFIEVPCKDFEHKKLDEPHLLFFDKGPMELFLSGLGFNSIETSYYGKTISDLRKPISFINKCKEKMRNQLLSRGILFPYSGFEKGLEEMNDPLERACVKPFKAHIEQKEPSWWLRAICIKK